MNNNKIRFETNSFKFIFRALKHRNYRLFFAGQSISLIGTWMQQLAMGWLVYRLTNSALLLGIIGFLGQLPTFIITPFAGVIADRYSRHRILIITQTLSMIQAMILSMLVFSQHIMIWQLAALSIFMGLINSLDIPVRQAFTVEMIENKEDLGNAIALNSSMVNMARLIGPSIAGVIVAVFGEGLCFLFNGISYIAVIISLLAMKLDHKEERSIHSHVLQELKEGFRYAFNFTPIKYILFLVGLVSLTGVPYQVLMPVFARDIYHGGPKTLGFLMATAGIGALCGAIYLASRKSVIGLSKMIVWAALIFGLSLVIFSQSKILWFSLLFILISGFAMMVHMAASNTILQTIVEEDKRGRVMSFYTMAFMGMSPFGSLIAGGLANRIGAPASLFFMGSCCVVGAGIFLSKLPLLRKHIRPVYIKKGIIPEVVKGIGAASGVEILPENK